MSKKKSSILEDISKSPEEIREVVVEGARQAKDVVVKRQGSAAPRIVLVSLLIIGLSLGVVALRRRT
jgi:hypothetical protein